MGRNIALWDKLVVSQNVTMPGWSAVECYGVIVCHDAGRSPLGAPPWRFSAGGRASISGIASGSVQRCSSQPGRRAWRAVSRTSRARGYEPRPQDATPRSAFQDRLRKTPLHERGWNLSTINSLRSQEISALRSQKYLNVAVNRDLVADRRLAQRLGRESHTRSTKLSTTRFSPALSNAMVSLLPSMAVTLPLPNFW